MSTSIVMKLGAHELQCNGSEEFVDKRVAEFYAYASMVSEHPGGVHIEDTEATSSVQGIDRTSVATIASKLGAKTGPALVMAACFRMARDGKSSFSRLEILEEMRLAKSFYRDTYSRHMSDSLHSLMKEGKLLQQANGVYSLADAAWKELQAKIA